MHNVSYLGLSFQYVPISSISYRPTFKLIPTLNVEIRLIYYNYIQCNLESKLALLGL